MTNDDGCEQRPLWQEVLLISVPIILTEGIFTLREYLRRRAKRKKREGQAPRA